MMRMWFGLEIDVVGLPPLVGGMLCLDDVTLLDLVNCPGRGQGLKTILKGLWGRG